MPGKITINQVSQLLRITPETIRFYEKKNIVNPKRDAENSYRYYTQEDIRKLYDCKIYQSMGFSLQEVIDIFENASDEILNSMVEEKEKRLLEIIEADKQALERISQVRIANDKAEHCYGKYYIMDIPDMLVSYHSLNDELDQKAIQHRFWQCVADYYNLFTCVALIPRDIMKSDDLSAKMGMGFTIDIEDAKKLNLYADGIVKEIAPRRCVYTTFHAEPVISADSIAPALDWMDRHDLKLTDDIICRTIKITFRDGVESRLYEGWFPID